MDERKPSFDAGKYRNARREQWNKDGAAWRRWTDTLGRDGSVSPRERESVWGEMESSMGSFDSPGGFEAPGEGLVGAATK